MTRMPSTPPPAYTFAPMPGMTAAILRTSLTRPMPAASTSSSSATSTWRRPKSWNCWRSCTGGAPPRPPLGGQRPGGPRLALRGTRVPCRAERHPHRGRQEVPRQGSRHRAVDPQPGTGGCRHRRLSRPRRPGLLLRRAGVATHQTGPCRRRPRPGPLCGTRPPAPAPGGTTPARSAGRCRGSRSAALTSETWNRWWRQAPRIVVVRAITEADDPAAAARALLAALDAAGN